MSELKFLQLLLVFFLSLGKHSVPVLVELLVLLDVCLLYLLLPLLVLEDKLLVLHVKLLLLQLGDSVEGHFSLCTGTEKVIQRVTLPRAPRPTYRRSAPPSHTFADAAPSPRCTS